MYCITITQHHKEELTYEGALILLHKQSIMKICEFETHAYALRHNVLQEYNMIHSEKN